MPQRQHATRLGHRLIYQGRVFTVYLDRVQLPNGHVIDMDIVRHAGSVVLLPVPAAGRIILIRQYRYTLDRWIWELPAGSRKHGEDPAVAAARECEEEIGLAPGRVERLGGYYPTPGFCDEEMIFFRCDDLRPPAHDSTARPDADEEIEPHEMSVDEARALIRSGEVIDLKTVAGLSLLEQSEK